MTEEEVSDKRTNIITTHTIASLENEAKVAKNKLEVFYNEHREVIETFRCLEGEKNRAYQKLWWTRRRNRIQLLREAGWQELEVRLLSDKGEGTKFLFHPKINISKWECGFFEPDEMKEFYEWLDSLNKDDYSDDLII